MQVRALRAGFYGADLKAAGAVFTVPDGTTASWFVPVAAQAAPGEPASLGKPQAAAKNAGPAPARARRGRPPSSGLTTQIVPAEAAPADPDSP